MKFTSTISHYRDWLAVTVIILAAVVTYGLAIARLGFYHDDWYMLWSAVSRGANSLVSLFSIDRPFMGLVYTVFYRIAGVSPPGWHVLALVGRIAGALAFYAILRLAWPGLQRLALLGTVLFIVYPGFLAEPNAATKVNHLVGFAAALVSIALTLWATTAAGRFWRYAGLGVSIALAAFYLWIYEYMIGLEVMRVTLMFWVRRRDSGVPAPAAARRTGLAYLPYALVIGLFLFWRVFIFESTRHATDLDGLVAGYRSDFANMALRLVFQLIKDFLSAAVFAWGVQPYHLFTSAAYPALLSALLLAGLVAGLAGGYLYLTRAGGEPRQEAAAPVVLLVVGALITLGAVFPVVLSNRFINLMDPYKAYALHPSPGVVLMVLGLAAMLRPRAGQAALVALIALSAAVQSANAQRWADYWEVQRNFWWQLSWRAPDISDSTLVMGLLPEGFAFQQDYELWGPLNLIYRPGHASIPAIQSEVLNQGTLMDVLERRETDPWVRDIYLGRNFSNLLLLSQPTTRSCLHVIDGTLPVYAAGERYLIEKAGPHSNLDRIVAAGSPPALPAAIFGPEPARGWCYYYQQAGLARQTGDWARVGELYDQAVSRGLSAGDRSEYFVFVEGLVYLGRDGEAQTLADRQIKPNDALRYSLCQSLASAPEPSGENAYRKQQIEAMVCE